MNEPRTQIPRQINKWFCHKLECFTDYIEDYTKQNGSHCYLELFAGCGSCTCKGTDCLVDGSELRALKTKNRFARCIFVVKNQQDAENLKRLTTPFNFDNTVAIIVGNCISEKVMRQVFDLIPRSAASLALIDPPGYRQLRWSVVRKLSRHGSDWRGHKMDMLIILPMEMALLRNLARPECEASINRLYGNQKWQSVRQKRQDGKILLDEARKQLVKLFKTGLKGLGYRYVEDFRPALFSKLPYYHLIWASDSSSQAKKLADIWGKPRYLPCELFHS